MTLQIRKVTTDNTDTLTEQTLSFVKGEYYDSSYMTEEPNSWNIPYVDGTITDSDLNQVRFSRGRVPAQISGPKYAMDGVPNVYTITNHQTNREYDVSCDTGTVTVNEDKITYTPPKFVDGDTTRQAKLVVDGRVIDITIQWYTSTPVITSPTNNSGEVERVHTFAYELDDPDYHDGIG